jgi:glycosyltransferase involved in cell wall biosynthesis
VALVGPVAKLAPEDLPRAPNLHYLGPQPYAALPRFLRGFDVCLMPFGLNAATRHISPTKALEYLAGGKPVVSTPVPDVAASWADAVHIAPATGFVDVVRAALAESLEERAGRAARGAAHVAAAGWDRIAAEMGDLIDNALAQTAGRITAGPVASGG